MNAQSVLPRPCAPRLWRPALAMAACLLLTLAPAARGEQTTTTGNPTAASARLDFTINIDKMIYLRIDGADVNPNTATASGQGPAASGGISELEFNPQPSIPSLGTVPTGSGGGVAWDATQPRLLTTPELRLFVEVRSNAGQVGIQAQVVTPLSNGTDTIPFSRIRINETNAALRAPTIPDSGLGPSQSIDVGGNGTTAAPGLLTRRFGQWGFYYLPGTTSATNPFPKAGVYTGELAFIATAL